MRKPNWKRQGYKTYTEKFLSVNVSKGKVQPKLDSVVLPFGQTLPNTLQVNPKDLSVSLK